MNYDVCIIGAGTAGMAAAYALKNIDENIQVALVETYEMLGGTAVNAWVQTWSQGITPPYLKDILRRYGYTKEQIENSILPVRYSGIEGGNLFVDKDWLSKTYDADMKAAANITLFTNHSLIGIEKMEDGYIKQVIVKDKANHKKIITARFFIDSSGDGVLCRLACPKENEDFFVGEDPYERFNEPLMKNRDWNRNIMNEPSLFYGVGDNTPSDKELLDNFPNVFLVDNKTKVSKPDYINHDGATYGSYLNPMTGMGLIGADVLENYDKVYKEAKEYRQYEHWKYIKLNLELQSLQGKSNWASYSVEQKTWNHTGACAPMLGIRESYRIHCDYMLRQQDLVERIDPNNLKDFIACGTETVDLHIYGNIHWKAVADFNENVQPSGIPYSCLIPQKLKNVLIACRAFGASHIALAARRVNKDMAQLGWAAGNAVKICCKEQLSDVRNVSVSVLQNNDYTGFAEDVKLMHAKYVLHQ